MTKEGRNFLIGAGVLVLVMIGVGQVTGTDGDSAEKSGESNGFQSRTLSAGAIVCNNQYAAQELLKRGKKNDVDGIRELTKSLECYATGVEVTYKMRAVRDNIVQIQISSDGIDDRKAYMPEVTLKEYTDFSK